MTDPIADMLTRIRNGYMAGKTEVKVPFSKMKQGISNLLKGAGYLSGVEIDSDNKRMLKLGLLYQDNKPVVNDLVRVSKPGRRVYVNYRTIPRPLSGYGTTILSTNKGLMTGSKAKKNKLGGEIVCEVW